MRFSKTCIHQDFAVRFVNALGIKEEMKMLR